MLCKRSADRAVPTVSLSWRPVDTRHSAGTEVPERKRTPSNTASELITPNKPGSFKIRTLLRKKENTAFFASFIHFILLKLLQIRTTYSGWSAGATGLHQSIWQQQRWVGLIPAAGWRWKPGVNSKNGKNNSRCWHKQRNIAAKEVKSTCPVFV